MGGGHEPAEVIAPARAKKVDALEHPLIFSDDV